MTVMSARRISQTIQKQQDSDQKRKKLTSRERKLFKLLLEGKTLTEAAPRAGYSALNPSQSGHQALKNIAQKAPDLFSRHGLDDDAFIEKHLLPALNAMEVKAFRSEEGIIYSKPLVAWGPRVATNRLVAEMKGLIVREQERPKEGIRVVIINQANRPPRPVKQAIEIPGLIAKEDARS